MDKYTVDLDKVLNDFEYSEYSLESAKLNKNVQEEIPNTSFNSQYSTKNDTMVKHSINNVFHSLNEYLSSDITPKKVYNVQKPQKNCNFTRDLDSSSLSEKSQTFLSDITSIPTSHIHETPQETQNYHVTVTASDVTLPKSSIVILNDKLDHFNAFSNFVEKTDNYSDIDNSKMILIENPTKLTDESTENIKDVENFNVDTCNSIFNDVSVNKESVTNQVLKNSSEFDHKIENDEISKKEIFENILVDLGNNEVTNNADLADSDSGKLYIPAHSVSKENNSEENSNLLIELVKNEEIHLVKEDLSCDIQLSEDSISKIRETTTSDEKIQVIVEKEEPKIVKIGFENEIDLDEDKLLQYFEELEEEFGNHSDCDEEMESSRSEFVEIKNNEAKEEIVQITENVVDQSGKEGMKSDGEIMEMKVVEAELSECEMQPLLDISAKEKSLQVPEIEISSELSAKEEVTEIEDNKHLELTIEENSVAGSITEEKEICTEKIEDDGTKETSPNVEASGTTMKDENENKTQEIEKNCRPQHLLLKAEMQDTTRKINLIGDPGSTPYNNVYSTKDFEKNNLKEAGSGDNSVRPLSPTYSDVSTDSISSCISDGTQFNDAVSEVHSEKKNIEEAHAQEKSVANEGTIQNNLISSGESCKNDVTTDKDFKNNLRTNLQDSMEASRSNVPVEDTEEECSEVSVDVNNDPEGSVELVRNEETGVSKLEETPSSSLGIDWLGKQAPLWIPDNDTMSCLHCDMKFTVIKRRHHCRACGLVLCSKCCNLKYRLEYLDSEARVCKKCYDILNKDTNSSSGSEISQESSPIRNLNVSQDVAQPGQPNPNNPLEYCSTVPPLQQVDPGAVATPSVMVPVGVLKRKGSNKGRSNKSVMFCDGIRPGSDLTNLDTDFNYSDSQKAEKAKKSEKLGKNRKNLDMFDPETRSFIPSDETSLPPTVTIYKTDIKYSPCTNNSCVVEMLKNEPLIFSLHPNVFIHVKIINMDCCVNRKAFCFSTEGLINVGQDEIVILLEMIENEPTVPKDIFIHLNNIYLEAVKGSSVKELGLTLHTSAPFLGSKNHAGFVYIRPTFQCLQNVIIPKEPYLIAVLIHRWETPWAKLFPLRLVLRLGAEYKYYPSPIISTRERDSVFVEIGHTIINLLADFRNFSYTLPQIRGLTIHMEDKNTTVTIPVNRYDQVLKGLGNSSDHILALAGNFSTGADSHLVCIQDTQSTTNNYSTHAINICNQPRKVTGASFIVFNGALKSTSGLTAKSNIVEDGLMIQILPEHMLQVRESLRNMKDHTIKCGCVNEESDETVSIVWGEADTSFNVSVLSPIDNKVMTGIPSIRVHNGKDYTCNSGNRLIRWTEVFIIQSGEESTRNQDPVDISKISENIARATCQALVKYLDLLVSNSFYKIGLRVNLHVENVSYSAGSNNVKLPPIYMKSLDNELIPVLHRITSNNISEQPIILELIFRILNI